MPADGTEAKVVAGVDGCSRFCVIASVVARATGRAVCLAFAAGLRRCGIPDEVLTRQRQQFTATTVRRPMPGSPSSQICSQTRENGPPDDLWRAVSAGSGGRIRTYDLWVMRRSGIVAAVAVRRQRFAVCPANVVECWVIVTRRLITAALLQPVCGPCRDHGRDQKDGSNRWGQVTIVRAVSPCCHSASLQLPVHATTE